MKCEQPIDFYDGFFSEVIWKRKERIEVWACGSIHIYITLHFGEGQKLRHEKRAFKVDISMRLGQINNFIIPGEEVKLCPRPHH